MPTLPLRGHLRCAHLAHHGYAALRRPCGPDRTVTQKILFEHIETYRNALTERPLPASICEAREGKAALDPGAATINKSLRNMGSLLKYAHKKLRWVSYNAAEGVEQLATRPRDVVLSVEELKRLLGSLEGPPRDANGVLTAPSPNWGLMIRLDAFTGMREGELLGLQWHDLHASSNAIYVTRQWTKGAYGPPKTHNGTRWVEVPPDVMADLRRWQVELRNLKVALPTDTKLNFGVEGHDPIFPTGKGQPHSPANLLHRGWYPALKRAGIYDAETKEGKYVRFHDLRRTVVSIMSDSGISEGDIAATLGHSIATMRSVYSHPMPKQRRGGTDAIATALSGTETVPKGASTLTSVKTA